MNDKKLFFETELGNWNDLTRLNHGFISKYVYRGQGDSNWGLSSSLERMVRLYHPNTFDFSGTIRCYEDKILKDFQWKYPVYERINIPKEDDALEWCAIMQHYGAPTRMVDFTYSPYIALYMAIENTPAEFCAIWCLNQYVYTFPILETYSRITGENFINPSDFEKYIHEQVNMRLGGYVIQDAQPGLFLIRSRKPNERICRQQGLFAIPSDMSVSFEDNVFSRITNKESEKIAFDKVIEYSHTTQGTSKQADFALLKINVSTKQRLELMKYLNQININAESMYPGLEGLAKSMAFPRIGNE